MGKLVAFRPRPVATVSNFGLDLNDTLSLLFYFELAAAEYQLLRDLMKASRRTPSKLSARLEVRRLAYRPSPGVLRLTPAGWAVMAACKLMGIGPSRREPSSVIGAEFPVRSALYPVG